MRPIAIFEIIYYSLPIPVPNPKGFDMVFLEILMTIAAPLSLVVSLPLAIFILLSLIMRRLRREILIGECYKLRKHWDYCTQFDSALYHDTKRHWSNIRSTLRKSYKTTVAGDSLLSFSIESVSMYGSSRSQSHASEIIEAAHRLKTEVAAKMQKLGELPSTPATPLHMQPNTHPMVTE